MRVRWLLLGLCIFLVPALGGCLRAVEISPDNVTEASAHLGNIKIEAKSGLIYYAQTITEGEEGFYRLGLVKVVDDGVRSWESELEISKESVLSIHYYENNKWVTGSIVAGISVFIVWLYYKINTSVFD